MCAFKLYSDEKNYEEFRWVRNIKLVTNLYSSQPNSNHLASNWCNNVKRNNDFES